jgi:hypothetical protein
MRKPDFPIVAQVDRQTPCKVRVYFTDGAVIDMRIPVREAKRIRIIDGGAAVKFGAGPLSEVSAWTLRERAGCVIARAPSSRLFPGQFWAYARKNRRNAAKRRLDEDRA